MELDNNEMFQDALEAGFQRQLAAEYQKAQAKREFDRQHYHLFEMLKDSIMQELSRTSKVFGINNDIAQRAAADFILKVYGVDCSQWFQHYL
jgi:hypothetical protein